EVPTTALPNPDDVTRVFDDLRAKGIRDAVFVMMSAGLSGTMNMVRLMCEQHREVRSLVYDSRILSMGLGYMVMSAIDLVRQGVKLDAMHGQLERLREKVDGFFYLPTLEYLARGGRIGLVAGTVGKLLNIRPIIGVNHEGRYYTRAAVIGAKKVVRQVLKITSDFVGDRRFDLTVMSGNAMGEAQALLDELKKLPGVLTTQICRLGPALAVHTGPGMLAVLVRAH
ncbi:MAG: DegV family protein, partial [Clostridiales bacterium]|nr:DegV family protein [Clostridiales bacterium]